MTEFKFKRDPLVSKLPITDPSVFVITPEFNNFIIGILKYRCFLKESTVSKYFDTESSMKLIRQAFIHKSAGRTNYEYLELKGDPVVNLTVSDYLDTEFPNIHNVEWATRIFHNLKSSKTLSQIAINNGFGEFLVYGDIMTKEIEKYANNLTDSKLYLGMFEDTFEALFGAITIICKTEFPQNSGRGVGYSACYNLMSGYLNEIEIETSYEEAWDPVSRLKELSDVKGWNNIKGCKFNNILSVYEIADEKDYNQIMWNYNIYINEYNAFNEPIIPLEGNKFIAFGYGCINERRRLLSVVVSGSKKNAKHIAAENVIQKLTAMNITQFSKFPDYKTWDFSNTKKNITTVSNTTQNTTQKTTTQKTTNNSTTKPRIEEQMPTLPLINDKDLDNSTVCKIYNLVNLDLSENDKITDRGLLCLKSPSLKTLNLKNNKNITNKGISSLTSLEHLNLENNSLISDVGIVNLVNLKTINLNNNSRVTIKGLSKLTNLSSININKETTNINPRELRTLGITNLKIIVA